MHLVTPFRKCDARFFFYQIHTLRPLQLIPKRTVHDKFPKAASITPTFRTAYLEVVTVGVRDLKPYGFQARNPLNIPTMPNDFVLPHAANVECLVLLSGDVESLPSA